MIDEGGAGPIDENGAGTGEQEAPITLEDAVHMALSWHPSIDEAVNRVKQLTEEIDIARAGYYPQIQGGIDTNYGNGSQDGWRPQLNISASQMIYDFGKVSSSVEARTAGAKAGRAQLLLGVDTVVRHTANAIIEVQRYQALLDVAEAQVRGVQSIANLVRQRSEKGASTRSDTIQANARVQSARSTAHEIDAQLQRWKSALASLLGYSGPLHVDSDVPQWLSKTCEAVEPDWSQVPAVMQAEARREEALAELDHAHAQIFPTISLEANAAYDLNRNSSSALESSSGRPEYTIGLRVSGNLYDGGATMARRTAAAHAMTAANASIDNAQLEVSSSLTEAQAQTSNLEQLLASLSERGGMMRETRDLYRQQYIELGTRTLLDLLNAEQELHQVGFDTANTVHDLRRLGVDCMFNSGQSRHRFGLEGSVIRGMDLQQVDLRQ